MDGQFIFKQLPTPMLLVDVITGNIETNNAFMAFSEKSISSLSELNGFLKTQISKEIIVNTDIELSNSLLINDKQIEVGMKFTSISEQKVIITFRQNENSIENYYQNAFTTKALNYIPVGIIIKNLTTGKTLFVSEYLQYKTGFTAKELSEHTWKKFTYKEDVLYQEVILDQVLNNSDAMPVQFQKRFISKGGKLIWFNEIINRFSHESNDYLLTVFQDITEIKENETALIRAIQRAEDAEKLKTAFLENMPHEVRTPLHAITGFTSLLNDSSLTYNERADYISYIQDSCNTILELIDNIIEIAKLETNQISLRRENCYINSLFDKLNTHAIRSKEEVGKSHIEINLYKANPNPELIIYTDQERLEQIMLHLLKNALKYTDNGKIDFGYRISEDNKSMELFVQDTGIGIPADQLDNIFKKFVKSGNINTDKNRGSGLGLALSKRLVELMGGEIMVETEQGKGSKFFFSIPLETKKKITIIPTSNRSTYNWETKNILVVEDTDSNYFFIEAFLEKTQANLSWAHNGQEAIDMFKTQSFDLILMDIMMPVMDGFDATREIRNLDMEIPIIAQTACSLPDDEEKCYEVGCNYVLVKPINSEDLLKTIQQFID